MYSEKLETLKARQILVTEVAAGSPADGQVEVGDVILGIGGQKFRSDARSAFGRALTQAESLKGAGKLEVLRWRQGKEEKVVLNLPVLGDYSERAPYECEKSRAILKQGCEVLARRVADPGYRANPMVRSLNAMALLASGDEKYHEILKKEAQWASGLKQTGLFSWWYGPTILFLAEYSMVTGDQTFIKDLRRLSLEAARGQSEVGSWGHKFIGENGRLGGYGMMNAPGIPLTIGLYAAYRAGVNEKEVLTAIEKKAKLLRFYVGKGAVPYGDHKPWIQVHEDNGKCGMSAVLFNLLEEQDSAGYFARMSLAAHGVARDFGHCGNFTNMTWAIPSIQLLGPEATGVWMKEYGAWCFDLARQWDGGFLHQGPPDMKKDRYRGWDATGLFLLAYAAPLRKLFVTGKQKSVLSGLSRNNAQSIFDDGKGWSNGNRYEYYDGLPDGELLKRLGSWSPVVRERAAIAISRRKDQMPKDQMLDLLRTGDDHSRIGVCQALALSSNFGESAVPLLRENLKHSHLWVRVKAAEALVSLGKPGYQALPDLLKMIKKGASSRDPRGMEQRFLSNLVYGKMLKKSIDGVDLEMLNQSIVAALMNEDGWSRAGVGKLYRLMSLEQAKPILPKIYDAIKKPAPSGIMFGDGVRLEGLDFFAKHRIEEGIELSMEVLEMDRWGAGKRLPRCLKVLSRYGASAKPVLPELKKMADEIRKTKRFGKKNSAILKSVEACIDGIENGKKVPTQSLRSLGK